MPLGRNRMNNQDAKAFFKEYNGLEYHMFHDGTLKYKEYEKLHISPSVKELWRQDAAGQTASRRRVQTADRLCPAR